MLALSRPPDCSSPFPKRTIAPRSRSRATSASAVMFTIAARSLARSPSGIPGYIRYARSVTTRPSTESPRNSSRSFVIVRSCSNANERWVTDASRSSGSRNETPSARSSASSRCSTGASLTRLLDLDRLTSCVVPAICADAVRELRLLALRACVVRRRFALPGCAALRGPRLALLLLGDGHRSVFPSLSSVEVGQVGEEVGEHGEPLIELVVARALPEVAVTATRRAEPLAIGAAERGERHLDPDHIADHLVGLEQSLGTERVGIAVLVGIAHEELVEVQMERLIELGEAAGASEGPSTFDSARNEDALHHRLQEQVRADRGIVRHPHQLRREVLDRPDDRLLARRAGVTDQIANVDRVQHHNLPGSSVVSCSSYSSVSGRCSSWGASA